MSSNPASGAAQAQAQPPSAGSSSPSVTKASAYAVGAIPAFSNKNYAAAASSKSKPSPPALNGKEALATSTSQAQTTPAAAAIAQVVGGAAGSTSAGTGQQAKPKQSEAVGTDGSAVNDKSAAAASASPASSNPKQQSTAGAGSSASASATTIKKPSIDMHSFFTGGGSPGAGAGAGPDRRSLATYDPQSQSQVQARSPQPSASPLPSSAPQQHQLSSNSAAFAPRHHHQQGPPPPAFIPQAQQQQQQQQQQAFSPSHHPSYLGGPSSPYQSSPYLHHPHPQAQQGGKTPSQPIIPNGAPQQGQQGQFASSPSRNGSFVGSPVMSQQARPGPGQPGNRQSFGGPAGPTSPRIGGQQQPALGGLGQQGGQQQGQMYPGQWAGQPYGQPYSYYPMHQPPQGYPQSAFAPQHPPQQPPTPSSSSTPRPPASPSPSLGAPTTPHFTPSSSSPSPGPGGYSSPQPSAAHLPGGLHQYASTPLRGAVGASEFKPHSSHGHGGVIAGAGAGLLTGDALPFTPSPRKSAAIQIRKPPSAEEKEKEKAKKAKEEEAKKSTATAAAAATEEKAKAEEKKEQEKKKEQEEKTAADKVAADQEKAEAEAEAKAAAEKKKAEEDKLAAEDKEKKQKAEAEEKEKKAAAAAEEEKTKKEAEEKKAAEEKKEAEEKKKSADAAAAAAKEKADAETKAQAEKEQKAETERKAAADKEQEIKEEAKKPEPAAVAEAKEEQVTADAKVDTPAPALTTEEKKETGAATLAEARSAITPSPLHASLPAKPVNGESSADDKATTAPSTPTSTPAAPSSAAISSARSIHDLSSVEYPENIKSPRPELNAEAQPGKYRYDREFLMQFMAVCTEKPEQLPNLEQIGMVDADGPGGRGNFGSGGGRRSSQMGPPAVPSRQGSMTGGGFGSRSTSAGGVGGGAFGGMGNFGQAPLGSSEARFAQSLGRSTSGAFGGGRQGSMSRSASQSGMITPGANFVPASQHQGGGRTNSSRGGKRRQDDSQGGRGRGGDGGKHVSGDGFENATLAPRSETGWAPSVAGGAAPSDPNSPEMVQRKVKALLNKLTLERFESISNQILEWADRSVDETDGRILRQVIALIFEKATDEANFSEMYARLCRKLMEKVSSDVKDETVKGSDGKPVAGGALFRKYLLNRCQEDYEAGWKAKEASAAAAAATAAVDNAKKESNDAAEKEAKEGTGKSSSAPQEAELLSDEYYAAQKAKRRGLGLVRFIGELYRLQMLTERIMHECIKKLLANTDNPDEEDVESLCRLLTTVGKGLDNPKAKQHMDIYFSRMNIIANNPKIPSRMRFMIQDVAELRSGRWQPRHDSSGPKLISEIHSDAQKAADEASRRVASSGGKGLPRLHDQLSRPNSRRGQGRDQFGVAAAGADGWSAPVPQRPAKAGDLSAFGRIRENAPISLGPSGAFANKAAKAKEAARPATPSNPFALLSGAGDTPEPSSSGRPKLVLAPRTKPLEGEEGYEEEGDKAEGEDKEEEEDDDDDGAIDPNATSMSRSEGERRAGNSVKEFFSVKSIAEGVESIKALPTEYRGILIRALADAAVDKKADDVNLTRTLFSEASDKGIVSHEVMLESLAPLVKGLIDLSVDVPSVYTFASSLLKGAGASREEVETLSKTMESEEDDDEEELERGRNNFLAAWDKLSAA